MSKKYEAIVTKSTVNIDSKDEVIERLLAIIENILSEEGLAQIVEEDYPDYVYISNTWVSKHIKDYSML